MRKKLVLVVVTAMMVVSVLTGCTEQEVLDNADAIISSIVEEEVEEPVTPASTSEPTSTPEVSEPTEEPTPAPTATTVDESEIGPFKSAWIEENGLTDLRDFFTNYYEVSMLVETLDKMGMETVLECEDERVSRFIDYLVVSQWYSEAEILGKSDYEEFDATFYNILFDESILWDIAVTSDDLIYIRKISKTDLY